MPHHRSHLFDLRRLRILAAGALMVVVALWAVSFGRSLSLRLGERYSIHSHRGTVQLHCERATKVKYDRAGKPRVVEITPMQYHGRGELPTVRMHVSAWRPISTGAVTSQQTFVTPDGATTPTGGYRLDAWGLAYWTLIAPLALLLVALLFVEYRRRGIPTGHCRSCGYDLRATPERCPECGTAAAEC